MRVAVGLREATARLSVTSDTARLDAELLMAHALGQSRSDMLLRFMDAESPACFAALVERRARQEPIAHIVGKQEFYGRVFTVTPATLIPRSDSETVIDAAQERKADARRILDLGTGSGALLLTMLAECPRAQGSGLDCSAAALKVADGNAHRLGLASRAEWLLSDWHECGWGDALGEFDLILCNPPYIEEDAGIDVSVRDYEPALALFSGPDGLADYRVLFPQLRQLLVPQGVAIFEIGASQGSSVREIAVEAGFSVEVRPDLAGRDRVIICT
ncbi:MAG: peptide chain release factor N(5)-glutamine methyltransferase [Qipengyuania sp.]